ncbi:MAG: adenylate kinase [Actinobacteria bacterium]|nr:MAG: adenylate kinase [Actinomycetota bacterium]
MNILLLGPQGAGKGTQAKRIAAEYGLPHIATGEMLRHAIAAGTPLGRKVKPIYDSGGLVPDDLMIELIRERLSEPDAAEGFVLDGFPRTFVQAEALDAMLREIDRPLSLVLELQVPDEVAIERLSRRAEIEGRADDTPEAIQRRLSLYHEETEPLVEYYRSRGNVVGIHGDRSENAVFAEIQQALEQAGAVA